MYTVLFVYIIFFWINFANLFFEHQKQSPHHIPYRKNLHKKLARKRSPFFQFLKNSLICWPWTESRSKCCWRCRQKHLCKRLLSWENINHLFVQSNEKQSLSEALLTEENAAKISKTFSTMRGIPLKLGQVLRFLINLYKF